jgi:LmbE family N-acetylglucosaminyl deacetylase
LARVPNAEELLERLCNARFAETVLLVVAHPDDEVIGAGVRLRGWCGVHVIHATDGAPRDLCDATAAGFHTRGEYAAARSEEARAALALAGVPAARVHGLGFVDQESSLQLAALSRALLGMLDELQPEAVVTHAYEGGHPDHDAVAFALHAACAMRRDPAPPIIEMTSYHCGDNGIVVGEFLPETSIDSAVKTHTLSRADCEFKLQLLACHRTQVATLRPFLPKVERFRIAPRYDFTQPPHKGLLFYEQFDWGMKGARWRKLTRRALAELGLEAPL